MNLKDVKVRLRKCVLLCKATYRSTLTKSGKKMIKLKQGKDSQTLQQLESYKVLSEALSACKIKLQTMFLALKCRELTFLCLPEPRLIDCIRLLSWAPCARVKQMNQLCKTQTSWSRVSLTVETKKRLSICSHRLNSSPQDLVKGALQGSTDSPSTSRLLSRPLEIINS